MGTPTVLWSQQRHPRLLLPELFTLDNLDMSSPLAMLDILMLPTLMPLDTHMVLLPTLTELLSLLMNQLSMLPRLLTLLPVVLSTQSEFTVMPTDMLDSSPTPTVPLSQLSPMRLLLPVLPILLPLLPHKNHLVC